MSRIARNAFVAGVGLVVFWLERRRRARPRVEPPVRHTSRNLMVAGIAAATVNLLEAPDAMPVSRFDPAQSDSNFSSGLAIWDRIHGTFRLDTTAGAVTIGVPEFREPVTVVECLELPFAKRSLPHAVSA